MKGGHGIKRRVVADLLRVPQEAPVVAAVPRLLPADVMEELQRRVARLEVRVNQSLAREEDLTGRVEASEARGGDVLGRLDALEARLDALGGDEATSFGS